MAELTNPVLVFLTTGITPAIANLASIVGFLITFYVMTQVRHIKGHYTARIRLPQLKQLLEKHASNLGGFLNDYTNNKNSISLELSKVEPVLQAIKKRLAWSERKTVNEALKIVKNSQHRIFSSEDQVRIFYNMLHGISVELEQWENDKSWSN